jgi:tRNA threonylcarbamoyladenosine biosynthesis protein TsaE
MKTEIITNSEIETMSWAEDIGRNAVKGSVFAIYGDLGTGKTIIAKGIAVGLGISEEVSSPTYLLLETYKHGKLYLYHFDLYRIENPLEFDELNFEEYWESEGVSVIEWAERAGSRIPFSAVKIYIERLNESQRRIIIEYPGN